MIKVNKKGTVKMKGSIDKIFTDAVDVVDTFCRSMVELGTAESKTLAFCTILLAELEEKDGYDADTIRDLLEKIKEESDDD